MHSPDLCRLHNLCGGYRFCVNFSYAMPTLSRSAKFAILFCAATLIPSLAVAQTTEPIQIGRTMAITGGLATYGQAKLDGGDAYIAQINKAGGVNGRQIVVTTLDDAYDPKKAVENLRKLVTDIKPAAFLGTFGVPVVAAALPVIEELRIPAVGLTTGAKALREPFKRYVFPVRASYADEAGHLVRHIKTLGYSRILMIHQDNPFGLLVRDTMLTSFEKEGLKTVADLKLAANGSNADTLVATVTTHKPDVIFLAMLSGVAVPTMRAIKAKAPAGLPLYTISAVDASVLTKELGKDAAGLGISQIVPLPTSSQSRIAKEYMDAAKALGRGAPSFYGLEAYIEAKVLVEGLKRAGKDASRPEAVTAALESIGEIDMGGFFLEYSKTSRRGGQFVELTVIGSRGAVMR